MKAFKATLIVLATLLGVALLITVVMGIIKGYQTGRSHQNELAARASNNAHLDSLSTVYIGKSVTINRECKAKQTENDGFAGVLHEGDAVKLVSVDSFGFQNAEVILKDGETAFVPYFVIKELSNN